MPTLIVENVPPVLYEQLCQRAEEDRRTIPEETLHLLTKVLRENKSPSPRLPDLIPNEEVPAPIDLPRSSQPVPVKAGPVLPRLPGSPTGDVAR